MSSIEFYIKGFVLGLAIAAPVGPIGILCIRKSLAGGMSGGFVTGLGAATADAFYGAVAAFGLTAISNFLRHHNFWLSLSGGIFLCYLGIRTLRSSPGAHQPQAPHGNLAGYFSTIFLTLANPATIISFLVLFAGFGLGNDTNIRLAVSTVLGVFCGSAFWWLFLSAAVGLFRAQVTPSAMQWINRLSGLLLIAFGIFALSRVQMLPPVE